MKKILIVANVAKEHILKFHIPTIKAFVDKGWVVDVACAGEEEIPYCHHHYRMVWERSPFTSKTLKGTKQLKKIIDKGRYDIVYCHTPVGGFATRLAARSARARGTKVIYCVHGLHFFKGAPLKNWLLYFPVEKYLAGLTDVIFTVNREDYRRASKRLTRRGKPEVKLVPEVGVDFTRLAVSKSEDREAIRRSYRQQLEIPETAAALIYVAELIPNKNQGMLIDALKQLREAGRDAYLILPGPDHADGYYQQYAGEQGVSEYCRFLGWRNDIGELMIASDICTASSIREGFGINLVEAMYCGLPVVATNNRGHQMVVRNGETGYLVRQGDSAKMAERVDEILSDAALRERLSRINVDKYDCHSIADLLVRKISQYAENV